MSMVIVDRLAHFQQAVSASIVTSANGDQLTLEEGISAAISTLRDVLANGHHVYIVGNGGSAAVASHAAIDFLNVVGISAHTLHESALLTCMANDYGYENAYARILSKMGRPGDVLFAISSSGRSQNICKTTHVMRELGGQVITLSGFRADNPLRQLGDINLWLESDDYGVVEMGHQFILHNLADRFGAEAKGRPATV